MKLAFVVFRYGIPPKGDPCCYPLGAMYISAYAKKLGHIVKVLNFNLHDYDLHKEFRGQDAVLFTGGEEFVPAIAAAASIAKEMGIHTVAGGAAATWMPFKMRDQVDAVVEGEGEGAITDALFGPGIYQARPVPFSLIPRPDYEGFGIQEYLRRNPVRYMGVLASRGCPFQCSFCAHTTVYRARPLPDVFAEIDHYRQAYGATTIIFNDNTLNVSPERFLTICEGMGGRGMAWSGAIRTDRFNEEMAREAKRSGCRYVVVGVESFQQDRLDRMGKGTTVEDNVRTLDLLHKYRIPYHGNLLLGFDWDTLDGIKGELATAPRDYVLYPIAVAPFCGIKARPAGHLGKEFREIVSRFRDLDDIKRKSVYFLEKSA